MPPRSGVLVKSTSRRLLAMWIVSGLPTIRSERAPSGKGTLDSFEANNCPSVAVRMVGGATHALHLREGLQMPDHQATINLDFFVRRCQAAIQSRLHDLHLT